MLSGYKSVNIFLHVRCQILFSKSAMNGYFFEISGATVSDYQGLMACKIFGPIKTFLSSMKTIGLVK